MSTAKAIVKEALNRLAAGENVESVANSLLKPAAVKNQKTEATKNTGVKAETAAPKSTTPEVDENELEESVIVIDCFECDEFSADNEEDLLGHYEKNHEAKYESVEKLFEAYDMNFEEAITSLIENDDEEEDDEEDDEKSDDCEEAKVENKEPKDKEAEKAPLA